MRWSQQKSSDIHASRFHNKYKEINVEFREKLQYLITSHRLMPHTCLEKWVCLPDLKKAWIGD